MCIWTCEYLGTCPFTCACVNVGTLGKMSNCMILKGMSIIVWICVTLLYGSGNACELCACVSVNTHLHVYLSVSLFPRYETILGYLSEHVNLLSMPVCLYENVSECVAYMPAHAYDIYAYVTVWTLGSMSTCVRMWTCENVNVCAAYVSIHAYECVHVRLCVAHQHSCICVTVCLLYVSAHVFECVWVSILSDACLGIVSICVWVFLSTVSILAPKCVFTHTQRYVWVCVCVSMGACLRDEEDTG